MMNAFRRWAAKVLDKLIGDGAPASGAAAAAAADTHPQPVSDASPAPEGAVCEAALPPAADPPSVPKDPQPVPAADAPALTTPKASPCRAVVLSDRTYSAICAEVLHRHPNETGGVFLGQIQDGVWYVVEATDPGLNTQHSPHNHQMDDDYLNHVYRHLSRMYRKGLDLLGLWHRHPGSFDRFSATDMATNADYARAIGGGTLSLLVNVDPDLRLTCYYCPLQKDGTVRPVQVPVLVGDRHFAGTEFLIPIYPDPRIQPVTDRSPVYTDKTA